MSSLPYIHFTESMTKVGETCTIFINSFLIYLTVFYIKNIKGGYKMLVLTLANLEIVFALLEYLIHPFVHSYNSSYIFFTLSSVYGASKSLKIAFLCLYAGIYALLICLIAIQFFYRYSLIYGSDARVTDLVDKFWWAYCSFWSAVFMFAYYRCIPDEDSEEYLREAMIREYNADVEEISGLFLVIWNPKTGGLNEKPLFSVALFSTTLAFQYMIMFYCGFMIHKQLKSSSLNMSHRSHGIQKQLFRTLLFQILNPCIFHHIPAFIILVIPFLDQRISIPSGLIFCFYSVFPPVDSMIMMYLVTEYRLVMKKRTEAHLVRLLHWIRKLTIGEDLTATVTS